jgi:hypothetical protein
MSRRSSFDRVARVLLEWLQRRLVEELLLSQVPESEGPGAPGFCWDGCREDSLRSCFFPRSPKARDLGHPVAPGSGMLLFVVVEQAEDVVFGEAIAAFQEVELDGEG